MSLNLYRRHRPECESGHPDESRSGEFEERKKGWKKCACAIFASGTLSGKFKRRYTGKSDWDQAKAVVTGWEEAQSWDGPVEAAPAPVRPPTPGRITIAAAVKVFLGQHEAANAAPATLEKYQTFTKRLTALADWRGHVMLDQFTSSDIDVFYNEWKLGARAKGKMLGTLRMFFARAPSFHSL
jgi:hypothetical protein